MRTPPTRATYQDVLDAPEHMVAEIIDGTLYTHPRPAPRHTLASSTLGNKIGPPFHGGDGGPGGWWILDEPVTIRPFDAITFSLGELWD